jgi:glycerol-3-phosphate dehydrogenase (NAD+)
MFVPPLLSWYINIGDSPISSTTRGSTIGKIIAENVKGNSLIFDTIVPMWVFEEDIDIPDNNPTLRDKLGDPPIKLSQAINQIHENIKYLPGVTLPENHIANDNLKDTVKGASILVFNLPHQFLEETLDDIKSHHRPYARGISCIKGIDVSDGMVTLFSEMIVEKLQIYCGALSGANIAPEVAKEQFCETTIGYDPPPMDMPDYHEKEGEEEDGSSRKNLIKLDEQRQNITKPTHVHLTPIPKDYPPVDASLLQKLFERPYFQVHTIPDAPGVSLNGALKNIIALVAGFVTGKGWGENTKAAIIHKGIFEMVRFRGTWFPRSVDERTFTEESAGIADLIASCNGGRNYRAAVRAVEKGVSVEEIERLELGGQKVQGVSTVRALYEFLGKEERTEEIPLFVAVYGESMTSMKLSGLWWKLMNGILIEIVERKADVEKLPQL